MANSSIEIPFYVSRDGEGLTGASAGMAFESLFNLDGSDRVSQAPVISEIGGGWYKFGVSYGTAPFDSGDLVGVIDADGTGSAGLSNAERYVPVEVRLDFYGLSRLVNRMSQDKVTGDMSIKNHAGETILNLSISETEQSLDRQPSS